MSLFEWFGESFNPGPMGTIDTSKQPLFESRPKRGWVLFFMLIGLALFTGCLWLIARSENKLGLLLFFLAYWCIAYFITPRPNTRNVGWAGGLIDHPFRISDDWNRLLIFFYVLLLPGKLMLFALHTFYQLVKYNLS
jgi:hypothetical protein